MLETNISEIRKQKMAKLKYWRDLNINPYSYSYDPDGSISDILKRYKEGSIETASIAGRIMAVREHGKSCFMDLADWDGVIQIYGKIDELNSSYESFKNLEVGDIIGVRGRIFTTKRGEVTVLLSTFELLSKSLLPIPEKYHGLKDVEVRYRKRYLDLIINPDARRIAIKRIMIIRAIRRFFESRGYLEVETPVLERIASGASAKPFTTHSNALDQDLYLRIALELSLKKLIIAGFPKVYELSKVFRNEDIDTRHNPEFTMLEAYEAYTDYSGMMKLSEDLFQSVLSDLGMGNRINYQNREIDFTAPWRRLSMLDAIKEYDGVEIELDESCRETVAKKLGEHSIPFSNKTPLGKMVVDLFEAVAQPELRNPTFITDFPKEVSPLTKVHRTDSKLAERFELYINGMEFANAYSELSDPVEQKERFTEQARQKIAGVEDTYAIDNDFIEAMEYGMPPTGGIGFGIDRMIMLLTDTTSIKEVILFPQMK